MTRAAPEFWLGMVLLAVFSFSLGWLPAGGTLEAGAELDSFLAASVQSRLPGTPDSLPAATLALYWSGLPLLLMRSNMLEVLNEDFVTHGAHARVFRADGSCCATQRATPCCRS